MALFEPLFEALNEAGVRYVVVGRLAVVLHGHARMTVDVDLVVDDEVQARRAIDALVGIGLHPRVPVVPNGLADPSVRERWIRNQGMQVFSTHDPSNPMRAVDLFVAHPIRFEDLWSRSIQLQLSTTSVRVASIPDLILMKRLAGRPQDRLDIEQLEAIQKAQRDSGDD